jgi:transposase-like protein
MSDKRYTKAQRRRVIEDWRKTGDPLCQVAKRCGVGVGAAYYWAKQEGSSRGQQSAVQEVSFAQLVRATAEVAPTLEVKIGRAAIRVAKDFDPEHLRRLVEALGGGADR